MILDPGSRPSLAVLDSLSHARLFLIQIRQTVDRQLRFCSIPEVGLLPRAPDLPTSSLP